MQVLCEEYGGVPTELRGHVWAALLPVRPPDLDHSRNCAEIIPFAKLAGFLQT